MNTSNKRKKRNRPTNAVPVRYYVQCYQPNKVFSMKRDRDTETEKETDRQTGKKMRHTETEKDRDREILRQTERKKH